MRRELIMPWLLSAATMYGLSYLWHGVALTDLLELTIPFSLYLALSGLVYLIIAFVMTIAVDQSVINGWIRLKVGFPLRLMLYGAVLGFVVYLVVFILGMSFADHGMVHVLVDVLWQMLEQALGGLTLGFGLVHVVRKAQLDHEGA